jgi:DNA-binding XRE family transcriptional regulator
MNEFKQLRRALDLSQREVALELDVSVATVGRIERGTVPKMALLALKHVAYQRNQIRKGDTIDWVKYP